MTSDEWQVRNEFSAVTLRRVPHGRGSRVSVVSSLTGSSALLDATVLEALSQLDPMQLAGLVGYVMGVADQDPGPPPVRP